MGEEEGGSSGSHSPTPSDGEDEDSDYAMAPRASARLAHTSNIRTVKRNTTKADAEAHLVRHVKQKPLDDATKSVLIAGLKKNRFCRGLDAVSMQTIVEKMVYFEFSPGDTLMTQGEPGNTFFVLQTGKVEVIVNDKVVDHIRDGGSFGGIALIYNTTRSATVVANEQTGVWGANGSLFRQVLREHSKKNYSENRQFLDQVRLFDGMSAQRKEQLGSLALLTEFYEPGRTIARVNTKPSAVYVLKSGRLFFRSQEGERLQTLGVGDSFGWRAVMFNEMESTDVVVEERAEVVGIPIKALKKALGDDLASCFLRSYFLCIAKKCAILSNLHPKRFRGVASSVKLSVLPADMPLDDNVIFAAIVDGEMKVEREDGTSEVLRRSEWCGSAEFERLDGAFSQSSKSPAISSKANSALCRLAVVTKESLLSVLKEDGPHISEDTDPVLYLCKALPIRRMPVFRELSIAQIDGFVAAMVEKRFPADAEVFKQGDPAEALFVIFEGTVKVLVDGKNVRTLGRGACFGERALVLLERRSATVQALGDGVALWCVDRQAFRGVMPDNMLDQMAKHLNMYGTRVTLKSLKSVKLIGVGAFGAVRLVEHKETAFRYALKRIRKTDGEVPAEVERECELLAENAHPFLLQFVAKFVSDSSIYILTELITGGELYKQVLEKMGTLSRKHAQFYIGSLALTLECLHDRSIVYRDLKPENVMLDHQGYIKLVDFGLAKRLSEDPRTYTCSGTPHYMAPEVIGGQGYGLECDIWSLGVMFFELVCGDVPFGAAAEDIPTIMGEILEAPLEIPKSYNDSAGKKLMQGLLCKPVEKRLGTGEAGWADIKTQKFFKQGVSGSLFSQIAGRELAAPLVPDLEDFGPEEMLEGKATLSDAEDLGEDEASDLGTRLRNMFAKLDTAGDGKVSRDRLGTVLTEADPDFFKQETLQTVMGMLDAQLDGWVSFENFSRWLLHDNADESLKMRVKDALAEKEESAAPDDLEQAEAVDAGDEQTQGDDSGDVTKQESEPPPF